MAPSVLTSIIIDAPPQAVWTVLSDIEGWPKWNTWITATNLHSTPLGLGTRVTFTNRVSDTAKPGTYTARITTWKPETTEFAWKGGPLPEMLAWAILQGHHWFRLVAQDGGTKTLFDHGETIEGLAGVLVPASMLEGLKGMVERFNGELKRKVEEGLKAK